MKRFLSIFSLVFLVSFSSLKAQSNINSYKYLLVQEQYNFQKSADQYQINSLTKFLFNKYGFNVLGSNEQYPSELALNPCMALKAVMRNTSSMLTTKVVVDLVDCHNKVIFSTKEGKTSIKDYKKGFNDAIRKAFVDIEELNYKFNGSAGTVIAPANVVKSTTSIVESTAIAKVSNETNKPVQNEVKTKNVVADVNSAALVAVPVVAVAKTDSSVENKSVTKTYSILGNYLIDVWGVVTISEKGNGYKVVGGDNFEFATITKTSMANMFMVKKTGFKDTHLLELDADGNLKIDSKEGFKVYKRKE